MGREVRDESRFCQIPYSGKKALNLYSRSNRMLVAASLTFILATTGLVVYSMLPPPNEWGDDFVLISRGHGVIEIDGDVDFSVTALLEGWPGDGSPENPYLIDGLNIDRGGAAGHCISILNTRVSFIMRNCRFTGAHESAAGPEGSHLTWGDFLERSGAGILLYNVANGKLVNNTCNSNNNIGIFLLYSHLNTVANNTCFSNMFGILVESSSHNTVANNTCSKNEDSGIHLGGEYNTVVNNNCSSNGRERYWGGGGISVCAAYNTLANNTCSGNIVLGICLSDSTSNTVANNTCNYNRVGIWLYMSNLNTMVNNTCDSNRYGIYVGGNSNTMANNTCLLNHVGIRVLGGGSNTMSNNMCNSNDIGISIDSVLCGYVDEEGNYGAHWAEALSNTVTNNICNNNEVGIRLNGSSCNTVENNTCNSNDIGIFLDRQMEVDLGNNLYWVDSGSNTVADNTCNNNRIGIYFYTLGNNIVGSNTFLDNTEHDIFEESATE